MRKTTLIVLTLTLCSLNSGCSDSSSIEPADTSSSNGTTSSPEVTTPTETLLIACTDCGKTVSKRASACPHCGAPVLTLNTPEKVLPPNPQLDNPVAKELPGFESIDDLGRGLLDAIKSGDPTELMKLDAFQDLEDISNFRSNLIARMREDPATAAFAGDNLNRFPKTEEDFSEQRKRSLEQYTTFIKEHKSLRASNYVSTAFRPIPEREDPAYKYFTVGQGALFLRINTFLISIQFGIVLKDNNRLYVIDSKRQPKIKLLRTVAEIDQALGRFREDSLDTREPSRIRFLENSVESLSSAREFLQKNPQQELTFVRDPLQPVVKLTAVTGTILYDGKPVSKGSVNFRTHDKAELNKGGGARLDANGNFDLLGWHKSDFFGSEYPYPRGIIAGRYTIKVILDDKTTWAYPDVKGWYEYYDIPSHELRAHYTISLSSDGTGKVESKFEYQK
jgi:DNA-directed RNA polymerase subunit RPC12/RpoP